MVVGDALGVLGRPVVTFTVAVPLVYWRSDAVIVTVAVPAKPPVMVSTPPE